ncbi:FecR family protein [Salegentibacter mishustinae]|jgi:ferric-dicitrate binding protein FerR (iron transport regulator)|uniref:FecR family protein n=1 Tax=Salegentibacter mishustinae TaxID=270918 RepID=UPI002490EE2D|nr:FecR domain-containing protein [Salegentibacter mishustinae]
MEKYQSYNATDFIADDSFLNWVLSDDKKSAVFWRKFLAENPQKQKEVDKAIKIIKSLEFQDEVVLNPFQKEKLLEKINSRIDSLKNGNQQPKGIKRRSILRYTGIAASFAIIAFLSYFFLNNFQRTTISTDFAEKREMTLPDGSSVILNANSEISYAKDWNGENSREVWLEGEAFFEVVKTRGRNNVPKTFLVHSGNLNVEVLGTSFNVGERRGETKVTLLTGKVKLENKLDKSAAPLILEPGEHAEVSTKDKVLKKSKVNTRKYASWVDDLMIFEATELGEIKYVLEDNFGLEVVFEDPKLMQRKFTGVIKTGNIEEFLRTLELSFDIDVTNKDGKIIFRK